MKRVRGNQKKRKRGGAKRNEPARKRGAGADEKPGRGDRIANDGVNAVRDKGIFYDGLCNFNFEGENVEDETESDEDETEDGCKDSERG